MRNDWRESSGSGSGGCAMVTEQHSRTATRGMTFLRTAPRCGRNKARYKV